MANYPQELAQDAVCQSHTGHMTGLWFLPARPLRLNTNETNECHEGFSDIIIRKTVYNTHVLDHLIIITRSAVHIVSLR